MLHPTIDAELADFEGPLLNFTLHPPSSSLSAENAVVEIQRETLKWRQKRNSRSSRRQHIHLLSENSFTPTNLEFISPSHHGRRTQPDRKLSVIPETCEFSNSTGSCQSGPDPSSN
jgi:hypothetical protein